MTDQLGVARHFVLKAAHERWTWGQIYPTFAVEDGGNGLLRFITDIFHVVADGRRLLFTLGTSATSRDEAFRNVNIYILELAMGNTSRLTQEGYYGYVSWSLDQKLIAYTYQIKPSSQSPEALYVMRYDGTCPVRIIESKNERFGGVSWSPDGRWIAFAWDKGIYLLDTSQRMEIELLRNGSTCP